MSILVTDTNLPRCIVKVSVYIYGTNINTERDISTVSYLHRKADFTTFIRYYWRGFVVSESENLFFPPLLQQSRYEPWHTCLAVSYRDVRTAFLGLGICMSFNTRFQPFRGDLCCFSDFPSFRVDRYIGNILTSLRFYFLPFISAVCCCLYNTFALLSFVPPVPIILFSCSRII